MVLSNVAPLTEWIHTTTQQAELRLNQSPDEIFISFDVFNCFPNSKMMTVARKNELLICCAFDMRKIEVFTILIRTHSYWRIGFVSMQNTVQLLAHMHSVVYICTDMHTALSF